MFLKWSISQIEHFSNGAILKSNISQMEQFSNRTFLKWSNSQIEQFSKSAIWGRHHQLDDSLVGQLTTQKQQSEGGWPGEGVTKYFYAPPPLPKVKLYYQFIGCCHFMPRYQTACFSVFLTATIYYRQTRQTGQSRQNSR